jgi:hypothetical protein
MKKINLTERRSYFDQFRRSANQTFLEFANGNQKLEKYLYRHALHVDPPIGTDENTGIIVQVNFPMSSIFGYGSRQSYTRIFEEGASLNYFLNDDGYASVLIHPCETNNIKRKEKLIMLEKKLCPSKLCKQRILKSHFRKLCLYVENTSVFGNPSVAEELSHWITRFTRPIVIDNLYQSRKIWTESYSIIKFVASVGLSGFLIFGIQKCTETNEVEKAAIMLREGSNQIENKIERSNQLQEKITEELILIHQTLDKANTKSDSIDTSINAEIQKINELISKLSNE